MSIVLRNVKIIKKSTSLHEPFYLKIVASNIPADINLFKVKEALKKKTNLKEQLTKVGK